MRFDPVPMPNAARAAVAIFFIASLSYLPLAAHAASQDVPLIVQAAAASSVERYRKSGKAMPPWPEPKVVIARPPLDVADEIATLKALQMALSDVGDGATYVWHRNNGRLSGIIKPTTSFRDARGQVCRHIVVWLTAGSRTKKTETIACRQADRVWAFEG